MNNTLYRYLQENKSDIDNLSILDSDLDKKEIFLIGENHGVKANTELKIELLKYVKEKTNFKYYLCELPSSVTYFLNVYLETGKESVLKDIYMALKGTDAWNKEEYDHWKDIYKFNKDLPKVDRIITLGIDIEHQPKNAFKYIEHILNKKDLSKDIYSYIKDFKDRDNISYKELKGISKYIREELIENEERYRTAFKDDYLNIELVNDNISNMVDVYDSSNFNGGRDKFMYDNFLRLHKTLPNDKFFGQIGLSHIFQRSFPEINWFASALKNDKNFKDKVLSIAYAYKRSKYLYPTDRKNYIGNINTLEASIEEFNLLLNKYCTVFKLNNKDSPFTERLIWPLSHKFPNGGVTTDYFQYLVVIKDSRAMEELHLYKN